MIGGLKPIIFISSTIWDLPSERKAAELAVYAVPAIPSMSEKTIIAQNKNSIDTCINEVKKGDIYVLILGGRYGSQLKNGKSITEIEWETAKAEGKPILVFNLEYIEKEPIQKEFANKVGDIIEGRFWKGVKNAFELKDEVEESLKDLLKEEEIQRHNLLEESFTNLVEINFPNKIYLGEINIDRTEVIKNSDNRLRKNASVRSVIFEALAQKGLYFSSDWVCSENRIICFHNLGDLNLPISEVIDKGTIEEFETLEYFEINNDYLNVFKSLLKFCLQQKLYKKLKIEWVSKDKLFRFMPFDENLSKRQAKWHKKNDATRTVFEKKVSQGKTKEFVSCKHLAFKADFLDLGGKWFLAINPDWSFTYDGKKPLFGEADKISYLKKNERNMQVANHFKFLVHYIKNNDTDDMYNMSYPFISFGNILEVLTYPKLNDNDWLNRESKANKDKLTDDFGAQIPLKI